MVEWLAPGKPIASAVYELYDYQEDPLETVNLAASNPQVLSLLKSHLAHESAAKSQVRRERK